LLENYDAAAVQQVENLLEHDLPEPWTTRIQSIKKLLAEYDFEAALDVLNNPSR
jgi:hypothetical protein